MDKSMLQRIMAVLAVSSAAAMVGPGCASQGETTEGVSQAKDDGAAISLKGEEVPAIDSDSDDAPPGDAPAPDSEACVNAPDLQGCGQTHGRGGYANVLYTCSGGDIVDQEDCPGGCVHQVFPAPDLCYQS
jgi:hypothetical protein